MMKRRLTILATFLAMALGAVAQSTPIADPTAPLSNGDALLIAVEGVGQHGIPAFREIVDSDGNILLPFIGLLPATGQTPEALGAAIAAQYVEAQLATDARATVTPVLHFDPAPPRSSLVRSASPLRPVAVDAE